MVEISRTFFAFLRRSKKQFEKRSQANRSQRRRTFHFEKLECREMMAVDTLTIDSGAYDSRQLLAQFHSPEAAAAIVKSQLPGAVLSPALTSDGWYRITTAANQSVSAAISSLNNRPEVIAATPDFRIYVTATSNDPNLSTQWGLENTNSSAGIVDADIDASQAWDYGTTTSLVVAVIDTGIDYNHVDLATNIWTNSREVAGNGVDDDRNGYVDDIRGWNFVSRNNNPMDDNGHGTHVAGIIGASGNNGTGVSGVAWNIKMMALKFLDSSGSGLLSDAVAAIDYARVNGAKVINASWGGGGFSSALQSAILRFQNAGGVFVAAAGNESANNATTASYPANFANVISVAASTRSDTLASFSNYGSNVDIAAPGSNIYSTYPGNRYASLSGTSMAAPFVSGAIALLWGRSPAMTATQITNLVMGSTDAALRGSSTTFGRLNVGRASVTLQSQSPATPVNPTPVNPTPVTPTLQTASFTKNGPTIITDATRTRTATTTIPIDVSGARTISDLNVALSIDHTYVGDLQIRLIGPDGTSATLFQRRGGSRDNIRMTFDDESTQSLAAVTSNFTGNARSETPLSVFDGKSANGRWFLQITDAAALDVGVFQQVVLQIGSFSVSQAQSLQTKDSSTAASTGNTNDSRSDRRSIDWLAFLESFERSRRRSF